MSLSTFGLPFLANGLSLKPKFEHRIAPPGGGAWQPPLLPRLVDVERDDYAIVLGHVGVDAMVKPGREYHHPSWYRLEIDLGPTIARSLLF